MRLTEKHIRHFNLLNGNNVSKKSLVKFHKALQSDISSRRIDAHMPGGVECLDIEARLAKAIKKINGHVMEVRFKPISLKCLNVTAKKPFKKTERMNHDETLLYGLPVNPPEANESTGLGFTQEGQQKIYDMVTNMILETMKGDGLFWREPWAGGGKKSKKVKVNIMGPVPANFVTKSPYSGVNYWLLKYVAPAKKNYTILNYLTINQVNQLGGKIRKGATAWPVIYYSLIYRYDGKNITEDQYEALSDDERKKAQKIPFIQYYRVFNAQDVEGVPGIMEQVQARKTVLQYEVEPIKAAEAIVKSMPKRPYIQHSKQRRAYYSPGGDFVHMPYIGAFDKEQEYYSTFFHELTHSTGHESRLDRELSMDKKKYAFEELIAELGASYLCAESGVLYFTLKNSAAYITSWSRKLREEMEADNKFFLKAAAKAQQASDFILDVNRKQKSAVKKDKRTEFKPKARGRVAMKQVAGIKKYKVVNTPKLKRESKRPLPPVERNKRSKAAAGHSTLNGLAGADQLTNIQFYSHELGPFKKEFHRLNSDSNVMIWGQPGHGKTVKLLQLAQHFAGNGKNVLYISNEEFGKSTLSEKINEFKIGHANLKFARTLDEAVLPHFDVVFFDSINSMGLTSADVKRLDADHPNKLFFLIVQTTKGGDFRGGKDWEHIVDIAGEVRNRKLILRKNRLDPDYKGKAEKLMINELVSEQKQKAEIKKLVKEQTVPAEPAAQ